MKRLLTSVTSILCLALLSLPAQAHTLRTAIATPDCDSKTIKLTFFGTEMDLWSYSVRYTIMVEPTGGAPIAFDGILNQKSVGYNEVTSPDYTFTSMVTVEVPLLAGSTASVSGSATLYQPDHTPFNTVDLTNAAGDTEFEVNCESPLGSLGDYVWKDLNGNGQQDTDEPGVDGVRVYLGTPTTDPNVPGGCAYTPDVSKSDTTAVGGKYLFEGLDEGDYCVVFEKPDGFTCTTPNAVDFDANTIDDAIDSDGASFDDICVTGTVSLGEGETDLTVDLGLVQTASLGDFVWEDLNGNGIQDNNEPGVNGVGVSLYMADADGDCTIPMGVNPATTMTVDGVSGIYGFDGLEPGKYCVKFDISTVPSDYCDLGAASFTTYKSGNGENDSDAGPNGLSDVVVLEAGDENLTLDAGIVCPAKIGDYVWLDADNEGDQDPGDEGVNGVTVELYSCGPDGEYDPDGGSSDDFFTNQSRVTAGDGMYMFGGLGDGYVLLPGCYYVKFIDDPNVSDRVFTVTNGGTTDADDSDCGADGFSSAINVISNTDDLTWDCGLYVQPPECKLTLEKSCLVETPATPVFEGDCKGRLQQFTVIWDGNTPVTVDGQTYARGDEATFVGPFGDNDVVIDLGDQGESVFHMSCSDSEFNGPEDCGNEAGDGKSNDSSYNNSWLLEGFIDNEGKVLNCTADDSTGEFSTESCRFDAPTPRSCENSSKPRTMVFEYTGFGCDESDNGQSSDKAVCESTGSLSGMLAVEASGDDKFEDDIYTVDPLNVMNIGDRFSVSNGGSDLRSTSFVRLTGADGTETNELHTSCSQPLAVGDVFGSLTLVGWDDYNDGVDVSYKYLVTNLGADVTGITITDDKFDQPIVPLDRDLMNGESTEAFSIARISDTTENTASATGMFSNGAYCVSNEDSITVTAYVPPCDVSFTLDKVEDDNLKVKVTNDDSRGRSVTLESITVIFPEDRTDIGEVKLDGAIYKRDDYYKSDSGSRIDGTPATIGVDDWTQSDVSKRQLDPGERRTLEIKTTEKSDKNDEFYVRLVFAEGCEYTLHIINQQIVP